MNAVTLFSKCSPGNLQMKGRKLNTLSTNMHQLIKLFYEKEINSNFNEVGT